MDVLVIGAGAREHALVWKLLLGPKVERVYVAPGNGGTSSLAMPLPYDANNAANINLLANWVSQREIGFTLVGPEVPLAEGVVDVFNAMQQPIVGPTQAATRIESSKDWAKQFMLRHNIPTAQAITFTEFEPLRQHLLDPNTTYPLVIKEDGLMAGKGVTIARSRNTAVAWLARIAGTTIDRVVAADFMRVQSGTAAAPLKVLIEEYLEGVEVSIHAFSDGKTVQMMPPVCDYKTIGDGDSGPMTGGMGAYNPTSYVSAAQLDWIREHIIEAAIKGMAADGHPYKGILYAGLMMTAAGPKVLEFNSRFGDPETQVLMLLLESDLADICQAIIEERLAEQEIRWSSDACVALVLAAPGYPDAPVTGQPIQGLDEVEARVRVFHAGTRGQVGTDLVTPNANAKVKTMNEVGQIEMRTAGGRVLTVAATAPTLAEARAIAYRNAALINFPGKQMRRDIALREISPEELHVSDSRLQIVDDSNSPAGGGADVGAQSIAPSEEQGNVGAGFIPPTDGEADHEDSAPAIGDAIGAAGGIEPAASETPPTSNVEENESGPLMDTEDAGIRLGYSEEERMAKLKELHTGWGGEGEPADEGETKKD